MTWAGDQCHWRRDSAVSGRTLEININNWSCPTTKRIVARVSALLGVFREQLAPHLLGVGWNMVTRQGLDRDTQQPLLTLRPSGVVKKKLRSKRCVRGLKGHGAASSKVSDAPVASELSDRG